MMSGFAALIATWGLPLIVVGCFFEGDSLAMLAGALAHRGLFDWPTVIAAAALGAFASDQFWFHAGRFMGQSRRVLAQMDRPLARKLRGVIDKRPTVAMFGFRFVWGTRMLMPLVLAQSGVSAVRFAVVDGVAVLVWSALMTGIGFGVGAGVRAAFGRMDLLHHLTLVVIGIVLIGMVFAICLRWLRKREGLA